MPKLLFLLILLAQFIVPTSPAAAKRVALIIGNSAYDHVEKLKNPENDARRLAKQFKAIGFDEVKLELNLTGAGLRRALGKFARISAGADVSVLYFAGHGIEIGGTNYVVPTDARLGHVDDVDFEAIRLDTAMRALNRAGKLKLVILDACRNNPFKSNMSGAGANRSVGRGLARVNPGGSDTLVAYAAKEGTVAEDGGGQNSPYARALLKHMSVPGLDVRLLFGRVRDEVLQSTGNRQEPFTYGSLGGDAIYLKPPAPELSREQRDKIAWDAIRDTTDIALIERFIAKNPSNTYVGEARTRIHKLEQNRALRQQALIEESAWNVVKDASSISLITSYLERYPNSRFEAEARQQLQQLRKLDVRAKAERARLQAEELQRQKDARAAAMAAAWQSAVASNNVAMLTDFIARYPKSPNVPVAEERIAELRKASRQKLAALTPQPQPSAPPEPELRKDLVLSIQKRLNHLGCDAGRPDGVWGGNSRRALQRFAKHAGLRFASLEPTKNALDILANRNSRICPVECGKREVLKNGSCVLKTCPQGMELSKLGTCSPRVESVQKPEPTQAKRTSKAVSKRKPTTGTGRNCRAKSTRSACLAATCFWRRSNAGMQCTGMRM